MTAQLYHGDCLEVLPTLDANSIDLVLTDPPYGIGYDASQSTQRGITKFQMLEGDDSPLDVSPLILFEDAVIWARPNHTVGVPLGMGTWYVWDKVTKNGLNVRIGECEFAWHKNGTKPRVFRHLWSGAYRDSESGHPMLHPTQKPVALMEWCLKTAKLPEGATVVDPYMGSGTTGVACINLGYNFIGIEIDAGYYAIAERRISEAQAQMRLPLAVIR